MLTGSFAFAGCKIYGFKHCKKSQKRWSKIRVLIGDVM
jgi:hypothetical protein